MKTLYTMSEKLEQLNKQIAAMRSHSQWQNSGNKKINLGTSIGIEICAIVLSSVFVGNMLDKFFATKPAFLVICIIFAFIVCFRNIWRIVR